MIARDPREALPRAIEIGAAIPDICDIGGGGHDDHAVRVYGKLPRLLPMCVSAHAIGDDKESRWLRSYRGWSRALDGKERIFVGSILAHNTRVQSDANQQAHRLILLQLILDGRRDLRLLIIIDTVREAISGYNLLLIDVIGPVGRDKRLD